LGLFKPVEAPQRDTFEALKFRLPLAVAGLLANTQPFSRRHMPLMVRVMPLTYREMMSSTAAGGFESRPLAHFLAKQVA
jgi:hypothetical protein